jgi:uncharacterized protein (TIGR02246 family)
MTSDNAASMEDREAIVQVFKGVVEAWNRADGAAYGAFFTEDADYIDVTGTRTRGGDAIGAMHQFLFDGPLKGSKLEIWDLGHGADIQFLAPAVALVVSRGASQLPGESQSSEDRESINTAVLIKRNGRWQVRAFQNNRVQRMQPTPFAEEPSSDVQGPGGAR